jgi:hypothetical protein
MAIYFTIFEHDLFSKIALKELEHCNWSKKNKAEVAPNVVSLTMSQNRLGLWVASEIVQQAPGKQRVKVIKLFISMAQYMRTINNFNGMMAVMSGLKVRKQNKTIPWPEIHSNTLMFICLCS